jgi:hypothetical protein
VKGLGNVFENIPFIPGYSVKEAYANYISQFVWDYFITQTFRAPRRDYLYAVKLVWETLENIFGATRGFMAVEPFKFSGDLHLHLLARFAFNPEVRAASIWKYLFKAYGRNRVEQSRDGIAVSRYCAKYVVKRGYHYEFCGDKAGWTLDT